METELILERSELVRLLMIKSSCAIDVYYSAARETVLFIFHARIPSMLRRSRETRRHCIALRGTSDFNSEPDDKQHIYTSVCE